MRGEHDVGAFGEGVDGLGEVTRPAVRIPDERAPQRQQVVQIVSRVLRHAQCAEPRKVEVHLGGRFGAGSHLEHDVHPVHRVRVTGRANVDGGNDQRDLTRRSHLAEAAAHLPLRSPRQPGAVHVTGAASHRRTGVHVLLHGVFGEVFGSDDRDPSGVDVGLRRHSEDATEVIDVAVGVDDRLDLTIAAMPAV